MHYVSHPGHQCSTIWRRWSACLYRSFGHERWSHVRHQWDVSSLLVHATQWRGKRFLQHWLWRLADTSLGCQRLTIALLHTPKRYKLYSFKHIHYDLNFHSVFTFIISLLHQFLNVIIYFTEETYRISATDITGIPPIPTQPIGFEDAYRLIWFVTR